jgi:hypothetical protein
MKAAIPIEWTEVADNAWEHNGGWYTVQVVGCPDRPWIVDITTDDDTETVSAKIAEPTLGGALERAGAFLLDWLESRAE